MAQFDLYVHGVPIGHEICGCNEELDYIKDFYSHDSEVKESIILQIDVFNGKSFYTYLRKKNVCSAIGRPGSYFGITVSFSNYYCTNVQSLYEILDAIYKQVCIGCLIKTEAGTEKFLVKEIATATFRNTSVVDYIKAAFRQNMGKLLSNSFDELKGFTNSTGKVKFSLKEVDSPLFRETLKTKGILVSPEFGTINVAYANLLKEVEPLREENVQMKKDNAQLREDKKQLTAEITRLETELSKAEDLAGKEYKKQLKEVKDELKKCKEEKEQLESTIKEATSAVDLMDAPINTLTRLLASRFPGKGKNGNAEDSKGYTQNRTTNTKKEWLSVVYIVLLFCILCLCGYGCYSLSQLPKSISLVQTDASVSAGIETNVDETDNVETDITEIRETNILDEESTESVETQPVFDDLSLCRIDIPEYSGNGNLKKGTTYSLRIMKDTGRRTSKGNPIWETANVPEGIWVATTNSELPGIVISGNKFSVEESVRTPTNVLIYYMLKGQRVITKTITVE